MFLRKQRINYKFLASFSILFSTMAFSGPNDQLRLDFSINAESLHSEQQRSLLVGPSLEVFYRHSFQENLELRMSTVAELFTGTSVGIVPSDILGQNGPRQDLRLREALVNSSFADKNIDINMGAINQQSLNNPLLAGDYAFVGSQQRVVFPSSIGNLGLLAEQAVPPSSFSLLETAAQESTPRFYLGELSYQIGDAKKSYFKIFGAYFDFQNLSTSLARQSLYGGNTVIGTANSTSFYLPYHGFEGGLGGSLFWSGNWKSVLGFNALQNTGAPNGSNSGYLARSSLSYIDGANSYSPEFSYFYDQSDSSPAAFSDSLLSSKNHQGFVLGFVYKDEERKSSYFVRWMNANPLVPELYVSNNNTILLGIEVMYDIF